MNEEYSHKKIVDLTEAELIALNFLGQDAFPGVRRIVEAVRANPDHLGRSQFPNKPLLNHLPLLPLRFLLLTLRDAETRFYELSQDSDALTVVPPHLITGYERHFYYHGISGNPPELMYRSDLETNPFPVRPFGTKFYNIPTKTANGVFNTPINSVWDTVAPLILASMKARGIKYSSLKTARFTTVEDGKGATIGPVVVWIAVRPNTTNAAALRDATPDILRILADFQITNIVVDWYEGSVVRLAGPPIMPVVNHTNPPLALTTPSTSAWGTLTFFFKEMKTSAGDPSDRILALTNKHVACADTSVDYEFDGTNPQHILVCSDRRLARALSEIEHSVSAGLRDAVDLARDIADLEAGLGTSEEDRTSLMRMKNALEEKNQDNVTLRAFFDKVSADWQDTTSRRFGIVDWAPQISTRVDDHHYTRDFATFEVDRTKLVNFERNIVDLGNEYNSRQLENLFWPVAATRDDRNVPTNRQLPIRRVVPRRPVVNPDTEGRNGEPLYVVGKYGNSTKLRLGRYSGMEAYTCDESGFESKAVAVYNYSKTFGNFSDHGDSGSLIFTGEGDMLAILHSGMPNGQYSHVTYGTPIWWVVEQLLLRYPSAEFFDIVI